MNTAFELGKAAAGLGLPKIDPTQMLGMPGGNEAWKTLTQKPATPAPSLGASPGLQPPTPSPAPSPINTAPPVEAPAPAAPVAPQAMRQMTGRSVVKPLATRAMGSGVRQAIKAAPRFTGGGMAGLGVGTLVNAGLEGLDFAYGTPEWAGGKGLGNPGLTPDREFLGSTRPDGTVFGYRDPTGVASAAGGAYNAWTHPVRSAYEIGRQAYGTHTDAVNADAQADKLERMKAVSQPATWNPN